MADALGLGPVRAAGPRNEAIVLAERDQGTVVDNMALGILACDRGLHAVVENLDRHPADRAERQHVTAQQRLQVLVHDEAREDVPGMAEHQGEQPDDPAEFRFVRKRGDEAGEVDLGLIARGRLEPNLERLGLVRRSDRCHEAFDRRVGSGIATLADLPGEPDGGQVRYAGDWVTRLIRRRGEPAF